MSIKKTDIEELWEDIVNTVDSLVEEVDVNELTHLTEEQKEGHSGKMLYVNQIPEDVKQNLEFKTIEMLEGMISLMYIGVDLHDKESRSDSAFLAKMSTRLHRGVSFKLDAPMAVAMMANDRNVYLLVNPLRLRVTCKTVGEVIAVIRHELYHILYQHLSESKQYSNDKKTQYTLNIAMDAEINQSRMIVNSLPEGTITLDYIKEQTGDDTLEEHAGYITYYKALTQSEEFMEKVNEMTKQEMKVYFSGESSGDGGSGGEGSGEGEYIIVDENGNIVGRGSTQGLDEMVGMDSHGTWGGEDVSEDTAEKAVGGIIRDTYNGLSDKERGLLSSQFKGQIAKLDHTPDVDWRDKLKRQHGRLKSRNKRKTLARPNRRYPNRLDLRGKLPDYKINIVMALDVSGSVSDNALAYAMGEGYHISQELDAPFTLLQIDSELVSVEEITRPTDFNNVTINARGGTRFQPAFDYLSENNLTDSNTLLVYVTDGYGESEEYLKRHGFTNVIWLLVDTDDETVLSCDGRGQVELLNNDNSYDGY